MVLLFQNAITYAQLPYTFTNTARNIHYGSAYGVAVDSDGTVFFATRIGGLHAYSYSCYSSGSFFMQQAIAIDQIGATSVHAADLDGDDGMDVLSASYIDNKKEQCTVTLNVNDIQCRLADL